MEQRFIRNFPAITSEEQTALASKHILIAGCGGLGGYLLEYMLRLGIGSVTVADGDRFDCSNLNRQLLSEISLLGKSKAEAAKLRAEKINPGVKVSAFGEFISEGNVSEMISGCDAVLDALDNIKSRKILAYACSSAGIPFIHGAISGWTAQAAISLPGDGLIDILYPKSAELKDGGVLSFTPALCAAMQAALCTKLLCGRHVETGKLYCFDLLNMDFESIPLG